MRKGYGPTGISFNYTFDDFLSDLELREATETTLWVVFYVEGHGVTAAVDPSMTPAAAREFYDRADNVTIGDGMKRFEVML